MMDTASEPWFIRLSKACHFKPAGAKMLPEGHADVHHRAHASTKNVSARNRDCGGSTVPRCDDARAREAECRKGTRAYGVRLCAKRHGHAALERGLRGQAW